MEKELKKKNHQQKNNQTTPTNSYDKPPHYSIFRGTVILACQEKKTPPKKNTGILARV